MQPDNKYTDDLEYLSQQGFEKLKVSEADINDLKKKIKARSFSYNNSFYFTAITMIMGVFIGAVLFFALTGTSYEPLPVKQLAVMTDSLPAVNNDKISTPITLDTVIVIKENFINPQLKVTDLKNAAPQTTSPQVMDSVVSIPEKPIDTALLKKEPVKEEHLKFIINAPVLYIHDMKVTNYTTLYFKKNHFVKFNERTGITAEYPSRSASFQSAPHLLKESADYFLHEEIAGALLYFKKGKYDDCINSLKLVAAYNNEDINCDFYMAMCYYYKANYIKAAELFDKCISNMNNTFLQEAMYYKAVSLFDAGNKAEALILFKQITDEGEFYAAKAKTYLK